MPTTLVAPSDNASASGAVYQFSAIGTAWQIDTEQPLSRSVRERVLSLAEDFDRVWSRFCADSLVTRIAQATDGGRFAFPARDTALLDLYDRLVATTGGAVDPLVGRDLELFGDDAHYTLTPNETGLAERHQDVAVFFLSGWLVDRSRLLTAVKRFLERGILRHQLSVWVHRLNLVIVGMMSSRALGDDVSDRATV
ncbi:FAD:protein FMN transferase [Stackebrandtia soli]|uniref:FAD:protein FMN transferase n=1 Tax=Stackebrandtia soli TaxID=1892856 RepID=UPI0039E8C3F6